MLHAIVEQHTFAGQLPASSKSHLTYLATDVADPELRKYLLVQSRATRAAFEELLREAVEKGELYAALAVDIAGRQH